MLKTQDVESIAKDVIEHYADIWPQRYHVHSAKYAAEKNRFVFGCDFSDVRTKDYTNLPMEVIRTLGQSFNFCLSNIYDYDGFSGSFLNVSGKTIDMITVDGRRTKTGLSLKEIHVVVGIGDYKSGEYAAGIPNYMITMSDILVTPKGTYFGSFIIRNMYLDENNFSISQKTKLPFTTNDIIDFAGFEKSVKPNVAPDDIDTMERIAIEALSFHNKKDKYQYDGARNGQTYIRYKSDEEFNVRIFRNRTSTSVEWGYYPVFRVTIYDNRIIYSIWEKPKSILVEKYHTTVKDQEKVQTLQRAIFANKMFNQG